MKTNKNNQDNSDDQGSKLPELAAEIKTHLGEAAGILKRSLEFYRQAGAALVKAKKELDPMQGRGGMAWPAWLKAEVGIEERVAQFYMQLARNWDKITSHPDFRVDLNYVAAIRLSKEASRKKTDKAVAGKIGPSQGAPLQSKAPALEQSAQNDILVQPEGTQATADGPPSDEEPDILPRNSQKAVAATSVNATAKVTGEADLVITPVDGYSVGQVLSLVAAGEAVVQEQSQSITKLNAEVIATFTLTLHTWTLTNLAALALAA